MVTSRGATAAGGPKRPRAFTLIELLVVIAIIALLVSILLPSLQQALVLARKVQCNTNQHALARASSLYATEHDGFVPRDWWYPHPGGRNNRLMWAECLAHYIDGGELYDNIANANRRMYCDEWLFPRFQQSESLHCPAYKSVEYPLHYVVNGLDLEETAETGRFPGWVPYSRPERLPVAAAEVIYITEANSVPSGLDPEDFGEYDTLRESEFVFDRNGNPNPRPRMIHADDMRHVGETTVVCFDGHAEPRRLTNKDLSLRAFVPNLRD